MAKERAAFKPSAAHRAILDAAQALYLSGVAEFTPSDLQVIFSPLESAKVDRWPTHLLEAPFHIRAREATDVPVSRLSAKERAQWNRQWAALEAKFPDDPEESPRVRLILVRSSFSPFRPKWEARKWSRYLRDLVENGYLDSEGPPLSPVYRWGENPETAIVRRLNLEAKRRASQGRKRRRLTPTDMARVDPHVKGTFYYGAPAKLNEQERRIIQQLRLTISRLAQIASVVQSAEPSLLTDEGAGKGSVHVPEGQFVLASLGEGGAGLGSEEERGGALKAAEECLEAIGPALDAFEAVVPAVSDDEDPEEVRLLYRRADGVESGWEAAQAKMKKARHGRKGGRKGKRG